MKITIGKFLKIGLLSLVMVMAVIGCKSPNLAPGGSYSPATTNATGVVTLSTAPEKALYVADASYKLAYDAVFGALKFERDNRADLAKVSPKIKTNLDVVRTNLKGIEYRWAVARKAYKSSPSPDGLSMIQSIVAEIGRLVPVVQAELTVTN